MIRQVVTIWLAIAMLLSSFLARQALAQRADCPSGVCYPPGGWQPSGGVRYVRPVVPNDPPVSEHSAHCRVFVGDGSTGSGTLIARNDTTGLVLTCAHLFDSSASNIVVTFPTGTRFGGRLIERDRANDLAAVLIRRPEFEPIGVDDNWQAGSSPSTVLTACGYGAAGRFRPVSGPISGMVQATGATDPSVTITGAVRPGDSGGGVLDSAGRLVGVVWGCRDGETYLTCGRPLRRFLDRVWRGRGNRPRFERQEPASDGGPPFSGDWAAWRESVDTRLAELDATDQASTGRLESLRDSLHTRIDERISSILPAVTGNVSQRRPGFFSGMSYGKLLAGALGVSGPVALAMIIAGGLAGRRIKSRGSRTESKIRRGESREPDESVVGRPRPIAVDTPPPPQQTVPETHFVPFEKDSFARAHQWASEQVVRKYPGATELLTTLDSLIKQQLAGSDKSS